MVELLTAILSVVVFLKFGISYQAVTLLLFTYGLIALSFIDWDHQFLPDPIIYLLLWLGLLISIPHFFISSRDAIIGAFVGYAFLFSIAKLYMLLRKKEGMGLGDCKMLAMVGAWVGAMALLNVLLMSTILAIIVSVILVILKKMKSDKPIPFGPFIAIAGWCTAMYGSQFIYWIMRWAQ